MFQQRRMIRQGLLFVAVCSLMSGTASGHRTHPAQYDDPAAAYRYGIYPADQDQVQWWFESSFPGGNGKASSYKNAILRADETWNALGRRFMFVDSGYRELPYDPPYRDLRDSTRNNGADRVAYCQETRDDPATPEVDRKPLSLVFWEPIPRTDRGPALGEATTCASQTEPWRPFKFFMAINSGIRDWYRNADGSAVPGSPREYGRKFDLQSVATHEFGHATGFYAHYDNPEDELQKGSAICGDRNKNRETMCALDPGGVAWGRTLGRHDKHTFRRAYEPR